VGRETWAAEVLSPPRALLHTRDARGLLAASELRALAEQSGGKYFQFRMCKEDGHAEPALGWVLDAASEDLMREQLRSNACGNADQLKSLLETLGGG
jgi:pyrroloquinoline quinone (PQQ) biosynthesis protein C